MNTPVAATRDTVLYTPRQIYVASFVGTPAAAAWFMALNHRALSEPLKQQQMLILGGVATVIVVFIAFLLPERTPNVAWPLIYSLGLYYFAHIRFGTVVGRHLAEGGRQASWWRLVGVSLLFMLGVVALLIVGFLLFPFFVS